MKIVRQISAVLAGLMFIIVAGGLFLYSLKCQCYVDIHTPDLVRTLKTHNIYLYSILTAVLSIAAILFWSGIRRSEMNERLITGVIAGLILAISLAWILFNDCVPKYDQEVLFGEARKICGFLDGPYNHSYMTAFKRQRLTTLAIALGLKIFGDSQLGFRLFNIIGAILVFISVCGAARLERKKNLAVLVAVCMLLFYPVIIYTSYLYGTILAVGFSSLGLYSTLSFVKRGRILNLVLSAAGYVTGILFHQSAAIACIAGCIFLILNLEKDTAGMLGTVIATVILLVCCTKAVDITYEKITGAPKGDAAPALGTVIMGITAENVDGGPGAQDGSFVDVYYDQGADAAKAGVILKEQLMDVIGQYADGTRDKMFFVEKTAYQWLEPSFCARKIIHTNDIASGQPANSERFMKFYESSARTIVYWLSTFFMMFVYLFAAISGVLKLKDRDEDNGLLIHILMIGGFLFSLIWETLPRYQLCYFIWMIPEACFGLDAVAGMISGKKKRRA